MENDSRLSLRAKKILVGIGIAFGTVVAFLVSFALSFSLIINPITLFSFDNSDTAKENKELKEKVETLNDEIEILNVTVDKYKSSSQSPSIPVVTTPQAEAQPSKQEKTSQTHQDTAPTVQEGETSASPGSTSSDDTKFSPETVTGTEGETPEDIEAPITVIDISEQ